MKFKLLCLQHPVFFVDIILQLLLPLPWLFNQLDLGITLLPPYFLNIFFCFIFLLIFLPRVFNINFFFLNLFPKVTNNELGKIKNSCVQHFLKQNDFMQ